MRDAAPLHQLVVDGLVGVQHALHAKRLVDAPLARAALRFTQLREWVLALPGFNDDPERSGEKILEAIQMAWIDEAD